ncbi:MAG: anaerobic ribonucleoside-triphosphate reductase activating protein [Spirochaetales bacterium]|nr:anaerobic ribonucleoside-triphosphate reductase activating protein [Spirochaetales bacterium]
MLRFGLIKTSLIDFPGEVAAVLFTRGCNLRCPYCHNPELVTGPPPAGMLGGEEVLAFLRERRKVLDGVCFSGGEPLLQPELPAFIEEARSLGYKIKIDTNGTLPGALRSVEADYIALDIKTLPEKYALFLPEGCPPEAGKEAALAVRESVSYVISSGIDHEMRATAAPGIFLEEDIGGIAELVRGAACFVLTGMRGGRTLEPEYGKTLPYPGEVLRRMKQGFVDRGIPCRIRSISGEGT